MYRLGIVVQFMGYVAYIIEPSDSEISDAKTKPGKTRI